jgi:hypothetical protein
MTRLLIKSGCYGDDGAVQRLDGVARSGKLCSFIYDEKIQQIVWRRSVPHDKRWVSIEEELMCPLLVTFKREEIFIVVTLRNWLCAARSAVRAGHSHDISLALAKLERAYKHIFSFLAKDEKIHYHMVSYDSLISSGQFYLPYLFEQMERNVPFDRAVSISRSLYDGNVKHYWEELGE